MSSVECGSGKEPEFEEGSRQAGHGRDGGRRSSAIWNSAVSQLKCGITVAESLDGSLGWPDGVDGGSGEGEPESVLRQGFLHSIE
ncbi:hypothetical protein [Kutzneria sp. 744]|uniref:hypothetical protein n=1 Tax=Kutzneria sp. (strain 744) TaxID=345341 RepID=UPI0005B7F4A1|nr:hypothetical protein [Kutzneria sp. 744]